LLELVLVDSQHEAGESKTFRPRVILELPAGAPLTQRQVASQVIMLPSGLLDSSGSATVGFTAATGLAIENHDILSWSLQAPLP